MGFFKKTWVSFFESVFFTTLEGSVIECSVSKFPEGHIQKPCHGSSHLK